MRRGTRLALILLGLFLIGMGIPFVACATPVAEEQVGITAEPNGITVTPPDQSIVRSEPDPEAVTQPLEINPPQRGIPPKADRPIGRSAVYYGKIELGSKEENNRIKAGERISYEFTVWNGNLSTVQYNVRFKRPDMVYKGWTKAPLYVRDWVTFSEIDPILEPRSERKIEFTLTIPEDAVIFADNWEFIISVKDNNTNKMIQEDLGIRVFVWMRE